MRPGSPAGVRPGRLRLEELATTLPLGWDGPDASPANPPLQPWRREHLQQWLVRLADGDRSAFEPLFQALWPLLRRFAARLLPPSADAEDAAQQALLKVFTRASEFDRQRDALTWIFGIVAWECRTVRRRISRRREEPLPPLAVQAVDSGETELLERDLLAAVQEVLGSLRPQDVEAIRCVLHGKRPIGGGAAFRKRFERAVKRLREAWRVRHGAK